MGDSQVEEQKTMSSEHHQLETKWVLWAHLPHDTDWSMKSYKKIYEFSTVEKVLSIYANLPRNLLLIVCCFLCVVVLLLLGRIPATEKVVAFHIN